MESEEWQEWAKSTDGYDAPKKLGSMETPVNPPDPGDEAAVLAATEEEGTTDPRKLPPPVPVEEIQYLKLPFIKFLTNTTIT